MKAVRLFLQVIGILTLVVIGAAAAGLPFLGGWLHRQDQLARSDFIIALAGDRERVAYAIDLYRDGFAPKLLFGIEGRVLHSERLNRVMTETGLATVSSAEFLSQALVSSRIPSEASAIFGTELVSTVEEAEALQRYLGDRPFSAILVTSAFHTRRAGMIFEHALPNGRFRVVAPPEETMTRWWNNKPLAIQMVNETAKFVYYLVGGAFRSSSSP